MWLPLHQLSNRAGCRAAGFHSSFKETANQKGEVLKATNPKEGFIR